MRRSLLRLRASSATTSYGRPPSNMRLNRSISTSRVSTCSDEGNGSSRHVERGLFHGISPDNFTGKRMRVALSDKVNWEAHDQIASNFHATEKLSSYEPRFLA